MSLNLHETRVPWGFLAKGRSRKYCQYMTCKHLALYAFLLYLKMCILPLYSVYCIEGYKSERKQVWVHWVWAPVYPLPVIYHAWLAGRTLKYQITWWVNLKTYSVEGFLVMAYASFASHCAHNRHVVSSFHGTVLENTTKCVVIFYVVHTTILQLSDKNISTHTLLKFLSPSSK